MRVGIDAVEALVVASIIRNLMLSMKRIILVFHFMIFFACLLLNKNIW